MPKTLRSLLKSTTHKWVGVVVQAFEQVELETAVLPQLLPHGILLLHKRSHRPGVCHPEADIQHPHLSCLCTMLPMPTKVSSCWLVTCASRLHIQEHEYDSSFSMQSVLSSADLTRAWQGMRQRSVELFWAQAACMIMLQFDLRQSIYSTWESVVCLVVQCSVWQFEVWPTALIVQAFYVFRVCNSKLGRTSSLHSE